MTQDLSANFETAASDSFRFLEQKYGFSKSVSRPNGNSLVVRYEGPSIYVNVLHGPPAYEPEMSFGRRGIDDVIGGYSFEVGDLVQLEKCRDWKSKQGSERVEDQVAWLASMLEDYGKECLLGDQEVYSNMMVKRDHLITKWRHEERYADLSRNIDAAWRQGNYKEIVALCGNYGGDLGNLNRKRLCYAQSRV